MHIVLIGAAARVVAEPQQHSLEVATVDKPLQQFAATGLILDLCGAFVGYDFLVKEGLVLLAEVGHSLHQVGYVWIALKAQAGLAFQQVLFGLIAS